MYENERVYERYEDAFFTLRMNKVAEANGSSLIQKNEELLKDPDAAVPDSLSKRCLHTIEKNCRKKRLQRMAKKTLRALNRVALWIDVYKRQDEQPAKANANSSIRRIAFWWFLMFFLRLNLV